LLNVLLSPLLIPYIQAAADNKTLNRQQFHNLLSEADSRLRALPATAQVAVQQGRYLANQLNHASDGVSVLWCIVVRCDVL
jgi:hypothetical protein